MAFPKLFETLRIGKMEVKNHIIMPPMTTNFAKDGFVTEQMKNYYEARARGGVGVIIVEDAIVESSLGRHLGDDLHIDDDKFLPGLTQLANSIKAHGAKAIQHLSHAGARAGRITRGYLDLTEGRIPVAPSSIAWRAGYVQPRQLTIEEIEELIEKYASAVLRAKEAGFDAVGFHCTHGYLINQFLAPTTNKRDDEYGRDAEGRLKFVLRIIAATQKKVGPDYPLMARISGEEPFAGGLTLEDMQGVARRLEQAGIQAFLLSRGSTVVPPTTSKFIPSNAPMRLPRGCMVYLTEGIKKAVRVPVAAVNRISDPVLAEQILEDGRADMIAMGRALLADPDLPNKAQAGRLEEIRTCIACQCCIHNVLHFDSTITCAINAQVGREKYVDLSPVEKPKRILVIGGGPAGMEAARVAAARGHHVELRESGPELGGQLLLASKPPGKQEIDTFTKYLEDEMKRLGVRVKTGAETTPAEVKKLAPDVVIVAAGARPLRPPLPGIEMAHVVTANEILQGTRDVKDRVVVLGGGIVGAEVAEYLAVKGKTVTIVEMLKQIAPDMPGIPRDLLVLSLKENGVQVITEAKVTGITAASVILDRRGKKQSIPADSVVLALGAAPVTTLKDKLAGQSVLWVGDCVQARRIPDAVREGFDAGAAV